MGRFSDKQQAERERKHNPPFTRPLTVDDFDVVPDGPVEVERITLHGSDDVIERLVESGGLERVVEVRHHSDGRLSLWDWSESFVDQVEAQQWALAQMWRATA